MRSEELTTRLIVLSACRSGSPALGVEHVVSLPAAFLAAGTAAVLGTLWHTDEMASLLLLTEFYRLWVVEGRSPLQALGDAQEWLIRSSAQKLRAVLTPEALASPAAETLVNLLPDDVPFAHPWYWAGFFLAGQ